MERTYVKEIKEGKTVLIQGWVHALRGQSKIKFLQLRDKTGIVQCVIADPKLFENFDKLLCESVVSIKGLVKKANVKSDEITIKDVEISASELEIINLSEPLPIPVFEKDESIKTELSKRLDYRFLDLHKKEVQAIFKVESTLLQAYREFMIKEGALECIFPSIIGASSEWGTEVFPVKYFEKYALLSQSCQLYKQMLAC